MQNSFLTENISTFRQNKKLQQWRFFFTLNVAPAIAVGWKARVRFQPNPYGICGDQSAIGACVYPSTASSQYHYGSIFTFYSHLPLTLNNPST